MYTEHFDFSKPTLHVEGMPITHVVQRFGTPLYLYNLPVVRRQYEKLTAIHPDVEVFYSLKANPLRWICREFRDLGAGAEVASGGELVKALETGFEPHDIIFVGPGKTVEEIELAVRSKILAVVVESKREIEQVSRIARDLATVAHVLLRLHFPHVSIRSPERMIGRPSQFGLPPDGARGLLEWAFPNVRILGVHCYGASQVLDAGDLAALSQEIFRFLDSARGLFDPYPTCIGLGGGFGVPYSDREQDVDLGAYSECLTGLLAEYQTLWGGDPMRIIVESGRFLVAESGLFVCHVLDIKSSGGECFLITDGGINRFLRPGLHGVNHPTFVLNKLHQVPSRTYNIVGPLCTPLDVLGRRVRLPEVEEGDVIGVFNAGAYGLSMSLLNFLSHPCPAEVVLDRNEIFVARRHGTFQQLLQEENSDG